MLLDVVAQFAERSPYDIVEPAHMELAEPSIDTAFDACVKQGAKLIIVYPYFLLPGRHWSEDIPRLAAAAAARHDGTSYLVAAPLGIHPLMSDIMLDRIDHCLRVAEGRAAGCDVCGEHRACEWKSATSDT